MCYKACFSILETVEKVCVAICLRSNHKMIGLTTAPFQVHKLKSCLSLDMFCEGIIEFKMDNPRMVKN